jgi:hypothetical protein
MKKLQTIVYPFQILNRIIVLADILTPKKMKFIFARELAIEILKYKRKQMKIQIILLLITSSWILKR